jgi:RNA polymerase sigma factor (TIGR02999 family)
MSDESRNDVTRILHAVGRGQARALDELLPLVYDELRLLASQKLSHESPGQTLQATALVHEAYLRLVGSDYGGWQNRTYFFGAAAEAMRRILVEHAPKKKSKKRGGDRHRVDFMSADVMAEESPDDHPGGRTHRDGRQRHGPGQRPFRGHPGEERHEGSRAGPRIRLDQTCR